MQFIPMLFLLVNHSSDVMVITYGSGDSRLALALSNVWLADVDLR